MSRSREGSLFLLRSALLFCLACGDGILVARELDPEDGSADESEPDEGEPSKDDAVPSRHRVGPRPTRHPPHHGVDFTKVHLRDAGSHALDD